MTGFEIVCFPGLLQSLIILPGGKIGPRQSCSHVNIERFQIEAASFWCDVEPVLRRAYDELLAEYAR